MDAEPLTTEPAPWQTVFRECIAPRLRREALVALRDGLASDSSEILQGRTTRGSKGVDLHAECLGACPIGYALWKSMLNLRTVAQVEDAFLDLVTAFPVRLADFTTHFVDAVERPVMVRELLAEVEAALGKDS